MMFREMRRFKQQISEEECLRILKQQPRGVLSLLGDDGYPCGELSAHSGGLLLGERHARDHGTGCHHAGKPLL